MDISFGFASAKVLKLPFDLKISSDFIDVICISFHIVSVANE